MAFVKLIRLFDIFFFVSIFLLVFLVLLPLLRLANVFQSISVNPFMGNVILNDHREKVGNLFTEQTAGLNERLCKI